MRGALVGEVSASGKERRPPPEPSFVIDEAKLHPPRSRPGIVARTALVDRLGASGSCSVVAVVAPAGYGKTTLLSQWAERIGPRVAWLSVDRRDNDPAVLLTYLALAVDRVERVRPRAFRSVGAPGTGLIDVARLAASMASLSAPVAVVLDHADALTNRTCRDIVAELAVRVPPGCQLAIGSRHQPPVPVARLRAEGRLVEVGTPDLAMDVPEATALFAGADVEVAEDEARRLVERTEGWPAGLYLAALALNAGSPRRDAGFTFTGDDRFMGDYLRSEFLGRVSRADVAFLTRTSILDGLSGPLCDGVVGGVHSGRVLSRLERRNLLVIPLDRRGERYRYHHLFRELLHAELLEREPEMLPELHTRAAAWYETNQLPEAALEHAQHAGDVDRVVRIVLNIANPVWASGRLDTVLGWMEWVAANSRIEDHPAIAVHGALINALIGRAGHAERWAEAAERTSFTGVLPDGNTMEGSIAYLRALLCRNGLGEMRDDARTALQGLTPTSPYRPAMLHAEGLACLLQSEPEQADVFFARALEEAVSGGVIPFVPVVLAARGLAAIACDDWPAADGLAAEALSVVEGGEFDEYWTSALAFAWGARMASRRTDVARAKELVARAARLRPLLTHAIPVVAVQALLELARAYLALADTGGARAALRQINDIRQQRPELGTLGDQTDELRSTLDNVQGELLGVSSLTTAELRLLPYLPTHLSWPEIGERLFLSRNTVKTQAQSIYRKLGTSSRSATIERIHELGLLPSP
jgi:LuxR family maltose regulon positive regulatory protein